MLVPTLAFTAMGIALALAAWYAWRQRELEHERAEHNVKMAAIGEQAEALAHDLRGCVNAIQVGLSETESMTAGDRQEAIELARRSAGMAEQLLADIRRAAGEAPAEERHSLEPLVQQAVATWRAQGQSLRMRVQRPFRYDGSPSLALSVVNNLLTNAVRAAIETEDPTVDVEVDGALRVTNRVREGVKLSDSLYERGVSSSGSTGLGLSIACDNAAQLGWVVRHEQSGRRVTFIAEPR